MENFWINLNFWRTVIASFCFFFVSLARANDTYCFIHFWCCFCLTVMNKFLCFAKRRRLEEGKKKKNVLLLMLFLRNGSALVVDSRGKKRKNVSDFRRKKKERGIFGVRSLKMFFLFFIPFACFWIRSMASTCKFLLAWWRKCDELFFSFSFHLRRNLFNSQLVEIEFQAFKIPLSTYDGERHSRWMMSHWTKNNMKKSAIVSLNLFNNKQV